MKNLPPQDWAEQGGPRFVTRPGHRRWLLGQVNDLLDFFQPNIMNPAGGFYTLNSDGNPLSGRPGISGVERQLHDTTRMVHCFAIAKQLERSGVDELIDHGMKFLWDRHRDQKNGGYFGGVDDNAATNPTKLAYGHGFVMLAAASAKTVGHPDADRLLDDVTGVLLDHFWEAEHGVTSEEYTADWHGISDYRGQNSNMHLTEALMAAFEATDERTYLDMANNIAGQIINRHARQQGWRVAEHFDINWQVDRDFIGDPVFRPAGITPGHGLEWSRLLIQLWGLRNRRDEWMPDAAGQLFRTAVETGWAPDRGGFYYTLGWDNVPDRTDRFWWPCAEGIAAAATLGAVDDDPYYENWYRRIWGFTDAYLIDHQRGGWFPELDEDLRPVSRVFSGKPDLYHALQACLIPGLPTDGSITSGLRSDENRKDQA